MDADEITNDTLIRRKNVANLLTKAGYKITASHLAVLDHHGQGPNAVRFGREVWHRMGDVRTWLEGRLGMPVEQAVALGRLRLPDGFEKPVPASGTAPKADAT